MSAIPLSKPFFSDVEFELVAQVLNSGWVTQGPRVAEFEKAFCESTGAAHSCAVSNCTAALHLALQGVGVQPGDVVLTVSMSFVATANAIRHCQAEPVFVDIEPTTLNGCPNALRECLERDFVVREGFRWYRHVDRFAGAAESPLNRQREPHGRLGALLVVHQLGMPCDLQQIVQLGEAFKVPVVEDAACALGSMVRFNRHWEPIGRPHGAVACFSFHPRKIITTGDGGMLTCHNADLDRRFRHKRQHGMSVSDAARHQRSDVVFESYDTTGYNYRLTDLQAALGIAQLRKLDDIVHRRRQIVDWYREALADRPDLILPEEPAYARGNWQTLQLTLREPPRRAAVMQELANQGISTRRGVMCAHREAPYRDAWPEGSLPHSEAAQDAGLIVPLFPEMTPVQVSQVASAIDAALAQRTKVA